MDEDQKFHQMSSEDVLRRDVLHCISPENGEGSGLQPRSVGGDIIVEIPSDTGGRQPMTHGELGLAVDSRESPEFIAELFFWSPLACLVMTILMTFDSQDQLILISFSLLSNQTRFDGNIPSSLKFV